MRPPRGFVLSFPMRWLCLLGVVLYQPCWSQVDYWEPNEFPEDARKLQSASQQPVGDPFAKAALSSDLDNDWFYLLPNLVEPSWISIWTRPVIEEAPDTLLSLYENSIEEFVAGNNDISADTTFSGVAGVSFPKSATPLIHVAPASFNLKQDGNEGYQLVTLTCPASSSFIEIEPNDEMTFPQVFSGRQGVQGSIANENDQDWYQVNLGAIRGFDLNIALKNLSSRADFAVEVYNPFDLTQFLGIELAGGLGENDFLSISDGTLTSPTVAIRVSAVSGIGDYHLFFGPGHEVLGPEEDADQPCRFPNRVIPDVIVTDNGNIVRGVTDVIEVSNKQPIQDLNVYVDIRHDWIRDLIISLKHLETGTEVILYDHNCVESEGSNIVTTFDDEGDSLFCPPWPGSSTRPASEGPLLSAFDGQSYAGTWILSVTDSFFEVEGTLIQWCLQSEVEEPPPTFTPTATMTATVTHTDTLTLTATSTGTLTPTITYTDTVTPTITYTGTATPTLTLTETPVPTGTPTTTLTFTGTATPSPTETDTPIPTDTPTVTPGEPLVTLPELIKHLATHEIFSTVAVGELDGDAGPELVFGTDRTGSNDQGMGVFALNLDGSPVAGNWPFLRNADVRSSPSLADLDHDYLDEVVVGTYGSPETILIIDHDGTLLATAQSQYSVISSPAIADLDGDNNLEIIVGTSDGTLMVLNADGTKYSNAWPVTLPRRQPAPLLQYNDVDSSPAIGDLDGDGYPDIAVISDDGLLYAYNKEGQPLPGFPFTTPRGTFPANPNEISVAANFASPLIVDVNGDGSLDVIAAFSNARVYGLRGDGSLLPGFPIHLPPGSPENAPARLGDDILSTPAVGDVDGDGLLELAVAFYDGLTNDSRLFVYDLTGPANADSMIWPTFHGTQLRDGHLGWPADGDSNQDGKVDHADLINLINTWQRFPAMPRYDAVLDFNRDLRNDASDLPGLLDLLSP